MSRPLDHWMPFRKRPVEDQRAPVFKRIRDEIVTPFEALVASAPGSADGVDPALHESLNSVLATVGETFHETHNAGSVGSLDDAVRSWNIRLQAFARLGGSTGTRILGTPPPLDPEQAEQLHLAVREAIGNAIRHASASRIELNVARWRDGVAVTVADDGPGIPPDAAKGLGMAGMRSRMERAGGSLRVHVRDGSVLEFRMPARRPSFWDWLRGSGKLPVGVSPDHHSATLDRWDQRDAAAGSLEAWFRGWTPKMSPALPDPPRPGDIPAWLGARTAAAGIHGESRSKTARGAFTWSFTATEKIDPLHWLDLALDLTGSCPLILEGCGIDNRVVFHFSDQPAQLPDHDPSDSFLDHLGKAWSAGLQGFHADLSAYLHDLLAQELVAEAMRWELARETCPRSALRAECDRCCHELRQLALRARSLSHELGEV